MRAFLLRIKPDEPLVLYSLSIVGVPLLMIAFSLVLPALRNPLFLVIGALVGSSLPSFWLNGSRFAMVALVAGLVLAALCVVFVKLLLLTT